MRNFLILFICTFFWTSYSLAEFPQKYEKSSIFWTTSGDGPNSADQFIKKFLEGRKLDPLEGIWMQRGSGVIGITKSEKKYLKYYINVPNGQLNGTIETTFFKTPEKKVYSGMVRIDFPNGEEYLHATSTVTLIFKNINFAEVHVDKYASNKNHTLIRQWPLDFNTHNEKIKPNITNIDQNTKKTPESDQKINELIAKGNDNDIWAQIELYYYYIDLKNYKESLKWIKKAAKQGNSTAQNNLGYMYDNGFGIKENKKLAFKWFLKAADQNQVNALTSIASYYLDGEVVRQSYVNAFKYYNRAANINYETSDNKSFFKHNQSRAIYGLGLMHEKGEGTRIDYNKAKSLYLKADENGHEIARIRYDALEGNDVDAYKLAIMYSEGTNIKLGIPIDFSEAAFWFKIVEYKGGGDVIKKKFEKVLEKISESDINKAGTLFEVWKKNSGFKYDKETLEDVTPYFISHTGTGFYINKNTLLTNKHVAYLDEKQIKKCDKIIGFSPYTGKYETYKHYKTKHLPKKGDIEILKSETKKKSYIDISLNDVEIGEDVFLIGFPQGNLISKYPKISKGIVNSEIGYKNNADEFIFDASSYAGSSGSPVLNKQGKLVGILWGGHSKELIDNAGEVTNEMADSNISYAIKSNYINSFLKENKILSERTTGWKSLFKYYFANFYNLKASDIAKNTIPNIRFLECSKKN